MGPKGVGEAAVVSSLGMACSSRFPWESLFPSREVVAQAGPGTAAFQEKRRVTAKGDHLVQYAYCTDRETET